MKAVIDASEVDAKELNALAIADDKPAPEIDAAIAKILKDLWVDPKVQETWKAREKLQVQDALQYFMDDIDRIAAPGWFQRRQIFFDRACVRPESRRRSMRLIM